MKILIINFEYPPLGGGGGVATRHLAQRMSERHEVVVLTTLFNGLRRKENDGDVRVERVGVWGRRSLPTASLVSLLTFVPAALGKGWRLCRRDKFDVINAQFVVPSGLVGVVLAKLFRVPFVLSFIGGDIYDPSKGTSPHRYRVLRWLVRQVASRAQRRTAISEDIKQHVKELHGVKEDIVVTHLGIEPSTLHKVTEAELKLPASQKVFISIGRLIPRKNYELLLEAWRKVDGANLVILGSGPLLGKLHGLINKYELGSRVQLRGFVSEHEKLKLLAAGDGYVSAADHEGFGIVFLEAMEAGLPIVATSEGGQTDFLVEGANALLFEPGDSQALANKVNELIRNDGLAKSLGERNRGEVKKFYLDKTVAKFEKVLLRAVQSYAHRD